MQTTKDYFNLTQDELSKIKFDDWTREDCLLADASDKTTWHDTADNAYESAAWAIVTGNATTTKVLQCITGRYALLTW